MNIVLPRTTFLQTLKLKPFSSSNGFSFRSLNFSSASCQQSVDVGDNSAGDVHEEVQAQRSATLEEKIEEKREELVKRAQLLEHMSSAPEQDAHPRGFPLGVVVESCARRWFKEHVKAAEKGDVDAQVTVGQMISHGYGVLKDVHKGEEWIRRAQSKRRSKQSKEPQDKKRPQDEDLYFM